MPYKIPFIGDQAGARDSWISAQDLVNMYPEGQPTETKGAGEGRVTLLPTPGLVSLGSVGDGPIRALIYHNDVLYAVSGNDFYEVDIASDGTITATQRNLDAAGAVSALQTSSGPVGITSSGKQGRQIAIADSVQVYVYYDQAKTAVITNVSAANPGVVTAAGHGFANGDVVRISGIVDNGPGGDLETELNDNDFIVDNVTTDTFELKNTDTSDNTNTYSSGGLATRHRWMSPGLATDTGDNTFGTFSSEDNESIGESGATDAVAWNLGPDTLHAQTSDNDDATAATVGQIDTGATSPGTMAESGSDWASESNATASDNAYATTSLVEDVASAWLQATNYSFSIPSAAEIVGVTVAVERKDDSAGSKTEQFQLIVGGSRSGTIQSVGGNFPTSDTTINVGGTYSMSSWGLTLTPTQVNASTFGFAYRATNGSTSSTLSVDHMTVNVHYVVPTDYLRATDRSGADLAITDIVTGIEVDIEAAEDNAGRIKYQSVQLILGGQPQGNDKGSEGGALTGADAVTTFGGTNDLWGLSSGDLTAAVVNSEQFGVQVSFTAADSATDSDNVQVDFINIKLYYDSAGAVAPTHIEWFDDYFISNNIGTGDFYWTPNGAQLWDANNDKATAQRDPDNIQSVIKLDREVWFLGDRSSEPWLNSGDAVPFDPIDNRFIDLGTAARYSVARYSDGLVWLSKDERGAGRVITVGGKMNIISTPQIEALIDKIGTISDAEGFTFYQNGHEYYQLTFPTAKITLVYDFSVGAWHRRVSKGHGQRHLVMSHSYHDSRHRHIGGSYQDGALYRIDTEVYTDAGENIVRSRTGQSIHSGLLPGASVGGSRTRLVHHGFELDCTRGHIPTHEKITTDGSKAFVKLEWSDDGGATFSSEKRAEVDLGKVGQNFRIRFKSLGQSYDRRYRITTEAPYYFAIGDAFVELSRGTW